MPRSLRLLVSVFGAAAFVAIAVVLLFADRSVAVLGPVRRLVITTGRAIESSLAIDVLDRSDIPGSVAHYGHAALWGTGMLVFGWILRFRLPLILTALFVAGTSVFFEAAQPVLSSTRRFEASDAIANFTGIVVATVVLGVIVLLERRVQAPVHTAAAYTSRRERH